jgi:hypothetical protein
MESPIRDWIDETLFQKPLVVQSDTESYAMALYINGAHAVFRPSAHPSNVRYKRCTAEPCGGDAASWENPDSEDPVTDAVLDPAVARDNQAAMLFVRRSGNNKIWAKSRLGGSWRGFIDLGGSCVSAPAAHTRPGSLGIIDVVCLNGNGAVLHQWRNNGTFTGFGNIGKPSVGTWAGSHPAVVSTDKVTTYIFVVGGDGSIWARKGVDGEGWGSWTSWEGNNFRSVAATSYEANRIDVFGIDVNADLYHRVQDGVLRSQAQLELAGSRRLGERQASLRDGVQGSSRQNDRRVHPGGQGTDSTLQRLVSLEKRLKRLESGERAAS